MRFFISIILNMCTLSHRDLITVVHLRCGTKYRIYSVFDFNFQNFLVRFRQTDSLRAVKAQSAFGCVNSVQLKMHSTSKYVRTCVAKNAISLPIRLRHSFDLVFTTSFETTCLLFFSSDNAKTKDSNLYKKKAMYSNKNPVRYSTTNDEPAHERLHT